MPTIVAPLTAAAPNHIEYSGTLSSSTPMCGSPSPAMAANNAARAAHACTHSTYVHDWSSKRTATFSSPAACSDMIGEDPHYRPTYRPIDRAI